MGNLPHVPQKYNMAWIYIMFNIHMLLTLLLINLPISTGGNDPQICSKCHRGIKRRAREGPECLSPKELESHTLMALLHPAAELPQPLLKFHRHQQACTHPCQSKTMPTLIKTWKLQNHRPSKCRKLGAKFGTPTSSEPTR